MVHYDPFSYETHRDPYPVYRALRDTAPAYYNPEHRFWALSRYDDVRAALKDHETYCSGRGFVLEDIGEIELPMIIGMDPPDHTRVRATIVRALTPRRIAALEPAVRGYARSLLAGLTGADRADFIADFAALVPMRVISEMLRVPEPDRDELRRLADRMVHREDGVQGLPAQGLEAAGALAGYFEGLVRERGRDDTDDLLSLLLAAETSGEISRAEIIGFCFLLIIAGNETTTKLLGNCVYRLSLEPDQHRRLLADRSLAAGAVEETLRFEPSTHMMARTLTRDVELHGQRMRRGSKVALILASANRDERFWTEPDRFDIARDTSGSLAFGIGIHHCVGAALARLEARVCLEELLAAAPRFELDQDGLERVHSGNVRGFSKMPIALR